MDPDFLFALLQQALEILEDHEGLVSPHLGCPSLPFLLEDLSLLGGRFAHWLQGILVCQEDPALPVAPEVLADRAHLADLVLFVLKLTDWESGSGSSCSETSDSE